MAVTWPTPALSTGHLVDASDWGVHVDNLNDIFDASGRIFVTATKLSFGAGVNADAFFNLGGSFTGVTATRGALFGTALTGISGADLVGLQVSPTMTEAGSGTHPLVAGVLIAPTLTNAAAAATYAASLSVAAPACPTGTVNGATVRVSAGATGATNNYALLVEAGISRLDTQVYINDMSNGDLTIGLTINQGASDNHAISLKSSDVAHGVTGECETDTYGFQMKYSGADGGHLIGGLTEAVRAVALRGIATTEDATKGTGGDATVYVNAMLKSGTGVTSQGATTHANLFGVGNNSALQFVVDAEGDIHMNATSNINAWDAYDDLALLEAYRVVTANPLNYKRQFARNIRQHAAVLERTGVISRGGFTSVKGLFALVIDGMRQQGATTRDAFRTLGEYVALLEARVADLEAV